MTKIRSLSYKIGEQYPNLKELYSFKNKTGAGQYEIGGLIGRGGPAQTMGYRRDFVIATNHAKLIPGPGTYESSLSSAPKYSIGKAAARAPPDRVRSPGPAYNPNLNLIMKKES